MHDQSFEERREGSDLIVGLPIVGAECAIVHANRAEGHRLSDECDDVHDLVLNDVRPTVEGDHC